VRHFAFDFCAEICYNETAKRRHANAVVMALESQSYILSLEQNSALEESLKKRYNKYREYGR